MNLLIIEDNRGFAETLRLEMQERGYRVRLGEDPISVAAALDHWFADGAIIDLRLKGYSGLGLLETVLEKCPECRAVVLTGYGSVPSAVEAIKRGALDYLTKPVSIERLDEILRDGKPTERNLKKNEQNLSRETLSRHEHTYIEYVLARCGGNISAAARWLGIHRQSLQRKLRKYPPPR